MRVTLDGEERAGRAVDLRDRDLEAAAVARAVRDGDWIDCPDPGPVHDRVSPIEPGMALSVRAAAAAAARTRGLAAPQDDAIAAAETELAGLSPATVDCEDARRRLAEAGDREAALEERVAELRGRIDALEEAGDDATAATEAREAAVRELAEVRTDRIAAEQALERARAEARAARDARAERLRVEDRLKNRRQAARSHLADAVGDAFADAVAAAPVGSDDPETASPDEFGGDLTTAALAVVRVAEVDAPVVLAVDAFDSPADAAAWLDAPVVRV